MAVAADRSTPQPIEDAFGDFDDTLKLDPRVRGRVQDIHGDLTRFLVDRGVIVAGFLQGSLARGTMRRPLKDVDKVVLLPTSERPLLTSAGGSATAMDRLEGALVDFRKDLRFVRSRHALKVTFETEEFTFDVVPAFEVDDGTGDVLIADLDAPVWERSNTRALIRVVAERNQICRGRFIHVVRIVKEFVAVTTQREGLDFPGLHSESIAYAAMTAFLPWDAACLRVFNLGAEIVTGRYTDPTGVDVISQRVPLSTRSRMQTAFASAARTAADAILVAQAGDTDTALRAWYELFGENFPEPPPITVRGALGTAALGGSIVGGFPSLHRGGEQVTRPTRPWRP